MANILLYKNFDKSMFTPGEMSKNKAGGNQVQLKYNNDKRIIIQLPCMTVPFGISEYTPENNTGPVKYSLDLSFRGYDEDSKIKKWLEIMTNLDCHMIDMAVDNSPLWFGKKMSREVVEELYRPLLKHSKDPVKYAPTMKLKIRTKIDNTMNVDVFNKDRSSFDINTLLPGSSVKCIADFAPVWFVNKQFGVTLSLIQMEVVSAPQGKLVGFAFQDDDDDEISDTDADA
jgi:hypothetical protein